MFPPGLDAESGCVPTSLLLIRREQASSAWAFVKDAPVRAPFLDGGAFEGGRSYFPPAACAYGYGVDAGVDVAELAAFLA